MSHPHLPIDGPTDKAYLFVVEAPDNNPQAWTKGNVVDLRGALEVDGVTVGLRDGQWFAGDVALGQSRMVAFKGWRFLFWLGRHDDPRLRAALGKLGVVGGGR